MGNFDRVILLVWKMFGIEMAAWLCVRYSQMLLLSVVVTAWFAVQYGQALRYLDRYYRVGRHSEFGRVIVEPTKAEIAYLNRHRAIPTFQMSEAA